MLIGVPREIKVHEYRVGLTPASVHEVIARGHQVLVETGAGTGIGAGDAQYQEAGARIAGTAAELFGAAELIVKVKEPQTAERAQLRDGQVLFTYLHLAPDPDQCRDLVASGAVCVAYETVTAPTGGLPLLAPMSEVAGRLSIQVGASCLERSRGGMGVLLGGVPGVEPARVLVLGAGMVGTNAAIMAVGSGATVTVLDRSLEALRRIEARFGARVITAYSDRETLASQLVQSDLVIGAVLVPGGVAPRLVTREHVARMRKGSVLVDVAIDQGGCFETSHPTTHAEPTFEVDGVVHYCVANMPGAVPRTSAHALNHATLPFVLALADKGWHAAMADDPHLLAGLNVARGEVVHPVVAGALGYPVLRPQEWLARN
ncbi:MAG TPA: alanine dehydrogenase [Burkholderiaceae bacterium]|jgi:alanine dehydrogenase|nr:alanine dehydrogenase [Burkholderiaceae bacterium]